MKKTGIIILTIGVLLMGIAAYNFVMGKRAATKTEKSPLPFPWLPTAGALFTATGIIMLGSKGKTIV